MAGKYNFIHERGDYPPLAIDDIGVAWSGSIAKTVGSAESPLYFIYNKNRVRIYGLQKNHDRIVNTVFQRVTRDKKFAMQIKKFFDQRAKVFLQYIKKHTKTKWQDLENRELVTIKNDYSALYAGLVPYGEPLPYFLKEKLQNVLDAYLVNNKKISEAERSSLMTPLYQSFINKEALSLFKIAHCHSKNRTVFKNVIRRHFQKYKWILFDYASLVVNERYFLNRARKYLKNPPPIVNYNILKKRKRVITRKYAIDLTHRYYLDVLEILFYLMDRKKEVLTQGHFFINDVYCEIGKRLGVPLEDLRWYLWNEVKEALLHSDRLVQSAAVARRNTSTMVLEKGRPYFLTKQKAHVLVVDIEKDERSLLTDSVVRGIPACAGKVTGVICHLKSAQENAKIKPGQILLVSNTTPDFTPAIHKASAIITNEGGLTCHAAIISRELNIPCVIGTKIATKVFKDGDRVEIDATQGIIKKL